MRGRGLRALPVLTSCRLEVELAYRIRGKKRMVDALHATLHHIEIDAASYHASNCVVIPDQAVAF